MAIVSHLLSTGAENKPPKTLDATSEGVFRILSDEDDQRIFLGLKFSIPGFLGIVKFDKYFFG